MPAEFRALAVFSGSPDVHKDYKREHGDGPNFLDVKHLGPFRDIPMFIFHGTEDLNCPFSETEALVARLQAAGADVEFVAEEGTGHSPPAYPAVSAYQRWLKRLLSKDE
jgi:predicted esterase